MVCVEAPQRAGGQVRGRLSQSHDLFNTSSPDAQFGPISVTPRRSCLGEFIQQQKQARAEISGCAGASAAENGSQHGIQGEAGLWALRPGTVGLFNWTNKHFLRELVWFFMAVFPCRDQCVLILMTGKHLS